MPVLRFSSTGVREVTADYDKINAKSREQLDAIKRNQAASIEFDRVVRGINRRNETEQDRYNRLLGEAKAAFDSNKTSAAAYKREVDRINTEMQTGTGRFRQYQQQQEKTFGAAALARLSAFAAGLVSIQAVTRLITTELQSQSDLRDKAEATKATIFTTRQDVRRNLAGEDLSTQDKVLDQNRELAARLDISEKFINAARAAALSASGGNVAASLDAVTGAARFLADKPGDIGGFAGSLLDLSKVTGTTDASVNLGLLTKVGALSRVVAPQQQAQNIPRALIGATSFGATARESAALFAALTTGSGDITGAAGGTGTIALAKQLRDFSEVPGATTGEKIRALQADRTLAKTFLGDASFEKVVLGPIEQLLLDQQSQVAQQFRSNLAEIPDTSGLGRLGVSTLASLEAGRLAPSDRRARALAQFAEREDLRMADVLGRTEIDNLRRGVAATGLPATAAKFITFAGEQFGGITAGEAAEFLQRERSRLLAPRSAPAAAGVGGAGTTFAREITAEERAQAARLEELIKKLVEINQRQLDKQDNDITVTLEGIQQ